MFFGTDFLCKCNPQPILKKIISPSNGKVEYMSVVQNRTGSASGDSEILLESFSDEEENSSNNNNNNNNKKHDDIVNDEQKNSSTELDENLMKSPDLKSHHDAAEIRRLLRRKDELERKQRMHEKYNERLQVSSKHHFYYLFGACGVSPSKIKNNDIFMRCTFYVRQSGRSYI